MGSSTTDKQDLARRLEAATPQDTVRGMIFNSSLELVQRLAGEAAYRSARSHIKRDKLIDFFSYPVSEYLAMAWTAADALAPILGDTERAFFKIGYQAVDSFFTSAVGKTLLVMVANEPRRLLSNAPTAYKTTVSYGERIVTWVGDHHCRIDFKRDFLHPAFHEGVITCGVLALGGKNVVVKGTQTGFLEARYEVTWE